ncbi:MAG: DUF2804 family protein [Treponema sp.]
MNIHTLPYTRKIKPAPQKPVENAQPLFGSYAGMFRTFDIKGVKRPFGSLPIPAFLTDMRVTDSLRLLFCDKNIIGEIEFFYGGYFSFMETTIWDRNTNRQLAYRRLLPAGFMHLPQFLGYCVAACRVRKRYVRIFSRLSKGMLHADFDFLASNDRPACEGRLDFDARSSQCTDYSAVVPYFVNKRCQASYTHTFQVYGWISLGHSYDIQLYKTSAAGFLNFRKTYTSFRTKRAILIGLGYIDSILTCFQVSDSVAPDSYTHNDNILFYGSIRIPLPPVRITRPFGSASKWVVQDTENMVDLVFTPIAISNRKLNAVICRTDYKTIYGSFEGTLLLAAEKELKLKNFPGIGKKVRMRI